MEGHQERVIKEKTALDEKIVKLNAFVKTETYNGLDTGERKIMRKQLDAMNLYSNILNERINSFEVKEPADELEEEVPGGASVATEDRSCPDCGAPEGEQHSEGCPTIAEETAEECQLPEATDESPDEGKEQAPDQAKEEPEETTGPAADDMPEEVDCFGTFDSNDAECANCNKKDDCYTETSRKRLEEAEGKEPAVEEPKDEAQEKAQFYTCKQCGKGFNEYVDKGDGVWLCPHEDCLSPDWM